jgi:DnaJ-class molecular chaperone
MGVYGMLHLSKCVKCGVKATAKDGQHYLCGKHWLEIYAGKFKPCEECGGEGQVEYERSVVDWGSGGYLEGYMDDCDKCNGSGELEYDI